MRRTSSFTSVCPLLVHFRQAYFFLAVFLLSACSGRADKQQTQNQQTTNSWYANAVIYNLEVKTFQDSDGDGMGDFKGLTRRLDYLRDLGITAIWLAPFQPSPDQDDGYDIKDYFSVDPRLGTMEDFQEFLKAAKSSGLKVMMDIVLNHTSIEHPWFKQARADTLSAYHKWYVWSKQQPKDADKGMVFPGIQTETWTYDEPADKYYFHRFYDFQPDLDYQREEVRQMADSVLTFWLKQGLDGFRLDAVPFIIDVPQTGAAEPEHMFKLLNDFREVMKKTNPEAVIVGEANVTAEENAEYFGKDATRLQMMFNFYGNQYLFHAMASGEPKGYLKALEDFRVKPGAAQWVHFLRNHDEIDLGRLSKSERNLVYERFGPERNMQLYERGIRRRLAPMLADTSLIRMAYSLLFSAPGAQMIRYGEEIGMGDDLALRERLSVRTPMQWDSMPNGGFSTAKSPFRPVIAYGDYSYQDLNVMKETANKGSLLNFIRKMIALRKAHPEIGLGNWKGSVSGKVLYMHYEHLGNRLVAVHNFSDREEKIDFKGAGIERQLFSLVFEQYPSDKIPAYGFQWYEAKMK